MTINKLAIVVILLLLAFGLAVFVIWPDWQEFSRLAQKLDLEKERLAQMENYFAKLEEINERLKGYEDKKEQLDAALPSRLSVPEFFIYLQEASDRNGVILEDLASPSIGESKLRTGLKEASFSLSFKGQYSALKNLLSSFWRNAKLIEVDSMSFSAPGEGNIIDFNVKVRTYSY